MNKFIDVIEFIKEIVVDEQKMAKFREIISDIKELIADIKDVAGFLKREDA